MTEKLCCPYCRKLVTNGRWIGTLHLCLSSQERAEVDRQRQQFEWQKREQLRSIASKGTAA